MGFTYRWRRSDRRWRKLRIREAAGRLKIPQGCRKLRLCLFAALGFEMAAGAGQMWAGSGMDIRFLRREDSCFVEWVEPGAAANGEEIYGVRLRPDSLELQFYHRSREVLPQIRQ